MNAGDPQRRRRDDAPVTAARDTDPSRRLLAEAVTINRPAEDLYRFWRDPVNLLEVMDNIAAIEPIDDRRSLWTVKAPAGREVMWESVITEDIPGQCITWQSMPGSQIANSGRIDFVQTSRRGTLVRAVIAYDPPGGALGTVVARLFQREPRLQTRRDLHRFKQLMETGEIATGARNHRIHRERMGG